MLFDNIFKCDTVYRDISYFGDGSLDINENIPIDKTKDDIISELNHKLQDTEDEIIKLKLELQLEKNKILIL